jgi:23S rRNA (cytidine1920-2'-O)/16S rRNA (cytidine1409-2'-O)-methyltransferase
MVRRNLARSRADAVGLVEADRVTVGGAPARSPARLVGPGESIVVQRADTEFVSRGGHKLAAALAAFGIDVRARRCLDAGASTGGFTDCLLQRGAARVVAVDVGHGQLAWSLRADDRVVVLERTNVRRLEPEQIEGLVDLVVADLSFISLRTVAPALVALARDDATFVLLVKPQFEAGRARVGKGGVIRDAAVRAEVVREVIRDLDGLGLVVVGLIESPITGADGNVEYLAHVRRNGTRISAPAVDRVLDPSEVGKTGP